MNPMSPTPVRRHPSVSRRIAAALAALAFTPAWGQWADPPRPDSNDPAVECYQAAIGGGREAYACDLAVQVARDSNDPRALSGALGNRAKVLANGDRLAPALDDLDAALDITPDNPDLHGNRGNLLLRLSRPADALVSHDRAVQLAQADPTAYYNRAFSYLALGDLERATDDVATAQALLPQRQPAGGPVSRADTAERGGRRAP